MVESTWAVFSWTLIFNRWAFFSNLIAEIAGRLELEGKNIKKQNPLNDFLRWFDAWDWIFFVDSISVDRISLNGGRYLK